MVCLGLRQEPRDFFDVLFLCDRIEFNREVAYCRLKEWQGDQTGEWTKGITRVLNEKSFIINKLRQSAGELFDRGYRESITENCALYADKIRKHVNRAGDDMSHFPGTKE